MVLNGGLLLLASFLTVPSNAQIMNDIDATINHSFIVSTKTLPPGKYVFHMNQDSGGMVMTVRSADGKHADEFMVRASQASTMPAHTELIFNRYGQTEFLQKIYETGSTSGVAITESSKEEKKLAAQGQHPVEHSEGG
jgi:hypothetical protein